MPPPSTPAPRRFLPAQRRQPKVPPSAPTEQRPTVEQEDLDDILLRGDAHDQFNITPRFSSTKRPTKPTRSAPTEVIPDATPSRSFLQAQHPHTDDVLDKSQSDPGNDDVMLIDQVVADSRWSDDLTLSPKRRRTSGYEDASLTETPAFVRPMQPASMYRPRQDQSIRKRFTSTPAASQNRPIGAPSFTTKLIQPHDEPSEPLPDAFSPHRRGEKYMPGGMAATLQQWVLETGQTAVQARRAQGRAAEAHVMVVAVQLVLLDNDAIILLQGVIDDGRSVDIVLIKDGTKHAQDASLTPGLSIGLKEPCWPLTTSEKHKVVCIDWKILH